MAIVSDEEKPRVYVRFETPGPGFFFQHLCERYNVQTIAETRKMLADEVTFYTKQREHAKTEQIPLRRWQEALKAGKEYLRPLEPSADLDLVFSLHYQRTLKKEK